MAREQDALDVHESMMDEVDPGPVCPACGWQDAEHRGPYMWHCTECDNEWYAR